MPKPEIQIRMGQRSSAQYFPVSVPTDAGFYHPFLQAIIGETEIYAELLGFDAERVILIVTSSHAPEGAGLPTSSI